MEQSFVVDGKKFTLSGVSGTVLSDRRTSTTHVSGSVGEAPIIGVYGSVKSHTTVDQEIWIRRDDDGSDFVIMMPKDVPLLGGQKITAVSLSHNRSRQWVFFRNESASTDYLFMSSYGFVYHFFKSFFGSFWMIVLPIIAILGFMLTNENFIVFAAPLALLAFIVVSGAKKKNSRRTLYKDALQRALNSLGVDYAVQ